MNTKQPDFALFLKALEFAAARHKHQKRKGNDECPYINHPIQVAKILQSVGNVSDWNVLIAAILHDTVEDTETTCEELVEEFSEKIAEIVMECTDDKNLRQERRKELQIITAPHKSVEAKLVKIADKISNVGDILVFPPAKWNLERKVEYLHWANKVVDGLRGVNEELDAKFDEIFQYGIKKLGVVKH